MTYNFNARKKSWLCVFNLPYKRNMARRWHVAAHNRQNGHQEHGRGTHIVLRHMKDRGGFFVFILTCGELPKSHSKKMQIVRAGFAVLSRATDLSLQLHFPHILIICVSLSYADIKRHGHIA